MAHSYSPVTNSKTADLRYTILLWKRRRNEFSNSRINSKWISEKRSSRSCCWAQKLNEFTAGFFPERVGLLGPVLVHKVVLRLVSHHVGLQWLITEITRLVSKSLRSVACYSIPEISGLQQHHWDQWLVTASLRLVACFKITDISGLF